MLTYQYQWLNIDSWEETGSTLSMRTYGQRYAVNQLGGSVALWNDYQTSYGKLTPSLNLRYIKDIAGNNDINQRHSLTYFNTGGSTFDIKGNTVGGDIISAELGANLDITQSLNLGTTMGYQLYDKFNEGRIGFTVSQRF